MADQPRHHSAGDDNLAATISGLERINLEHEDFLAPSRSVNPYWLYLQRRGLDSTRDGTPSNDMHRVPTVSPGPLSNPYLLVISTRDGTRPNDLDQAPAFTPEPIHRHAPASGSSCAAAVFLKSLPAVRPEDLDNDSRTCHICQEDFPPPDFSADTTADTPVKLPACNHIFGRACLGTWLTGHRNNSCPLCRAALFKESVSTSPDMTDRIRTLGF